MPSYDDSRYLYDSEDPLLTYDGTYLYPVRTGVQPSGTGQVTSYRLVRRTLTGAQPVATSGQVTSHRVVRRTLTGAQPVAASAQVTPRQVVRRILTGAQPVAASGSLGEKTTYRRTLTGAPPASTGEIQTEALHRRPLQGAQPAATGQLVPRLVSLVKLAGAELAPDGALTAHRTYSVQLQGTQPEATGQISRHRLYSRTLMGQQDSGQAGGIVRQTGHYRRMLVGAQPEALGAVTRRYFHIYHVSLSGQQPLGSGIDYDEPGVTYDDPGFLYEDQDAGQLTWHARFFRRLLGVQPPASSADIVWGWNPYVWAQYYLSITDRPEVIQYQYDLDADDHTIAYDVDEDLLHDPVVYKVAGVKVYSQPPPGVRERS